MDTYGRLFDGVDQESAAKREKFFGPDTKVVQMAMRKGAWAETLAYGRRATTACFTVATTLINIKNPPMDRERHQTFRVPVIATAL